MSSTNQPLSQGDGYGIVLGLGAVFAAGMMAITFCLEHYHNEARDSSEGFSTANHKVKTGLIASNVVSSWTWVSTLLQSSSVAYSYGVSGPFWYASGATVQIILFCIIAIELKRRAPFAHTFLEVVHARYDRAGHLIFIVFCLCTNILVTVMLLTAGSTVVHSLSGMHIEAACFLLPLAPILYTMFGGIKATFLTDYAHTVAVLIIILIFAFTAYTSSSLLGSPSKVYDLLVNASHAHPVQGNAQGSYLTMRSKEGAIFFVINIIGNFGTIFLDNGYYNKAIAASPVSALPGYILGGLSWFAVPFLAATTMGLAAVALESNPAFPTYPNRLSAEDVSDGLTLPAAAVALLGKSGAVATVIMIFMAVTSAMSAQLVAVSSIVTYDIYKTYINREANGRKLIYISHISVCLFGLIMSALSVGVYYAKINLIYLHLLMGVIISSAVVPGTLTLLWNRQSKLAVCLSPPVGLIFAIMAWLVTAKVRYGSINVETTGSHIPMLVGNVVGLLSPLVFVPLFTFIKPDKTLYDYASMKDIKAADDGPQSNSVCTSEDMDRELSLLERNSKVARIVAVTLILCLLVVWPWPMYGTSYVFSKPFFIGWVAIAIIWLFISFCIVGIYPIVESWKTIVSVSRKIYVDLMKRYSRGIDSEDRDPIQDTEMM